MKPRSTKPVERTARRAALELSRILVPIDYSDASRHALRYAATLAERLGAGLHLLAVIEPVTYMSSLEQMPYIVASDAESAQSAERDLEKLVEHELSSEVPVTLAVKKGKAPEVINSTAAQLKADLIIIATHGRSGLERILLGSTAEQVIRHAPCPVLTVRRQVLPKLGRRPRRSAANHVGKSES